MGLGGVADFMWMSLSDGVPVLNAEPALESIGAHFLFQLLLFLIIGGGGWGSSTV